MFAKNTRLGGKVAGPNPVALTKESERYISVSRYYSYLTFIFLVRPSRSLMMFIPF